MSASKEDASGYLSRTAAENVIETGCDIDADIAALRSGAHTEATLLAHCLDGADDDRKEGWRDYVRAIACAAGCVQR